jgi:hypothetical protein
MNPMTISFPLALTAAQIHRASPEPISEGKGLELAQELHDLIDEVQAVYTKHPPSQANPAERLPTADADLPCETAVAFELAELISTVWRTTLGFWPEGSDATASESEWVMDRLTFFAGTDLYAQYLRLYDQIHLANLLEVAFDDDPPPPRSVPRQDASSNGRAT